MRRAIIVTWAAAATLAVAAGCSSKGADPTQPKMTDEQIKDVMKQGKEQYQKEHGKLGRGGAPGRP